MRLAYGLAGCVLVATGLAGCSREAPPTYAAPPAYLPPPAPTGATATPPAAERMTIARACAADIERFCSGVPPRQGMVKACMKSHVSELSAGCFDAVMGAIAAQQAP